MPALIWLQVKNTALFSDFNFTPGENEMNHLNKHFASSIKALCMAILIVCTTPSWAWVGSTHTPVKRMNDFTRWYLQTFRPIAKQVAAEAIVAAPVVYPGMPTVQQLTDDYTLFENTLAKFNQQEKSNLMADFRQRLLVLSATAEWGDEYRLYKTPSLFTPKQINVFNQFFQPNLRYYQHFLQQANPAEVAPVAAIIKAQEINDDRRLISGNDWSGQTSNTKDRVIQDGNELSVALGDNRKRVERESLKNTHSGLATYVFGPHYGNKNRILHGAQINSSHYNYERDNANFITSYSDRYGERQYAVVKSHLYDLFDQDLNTTIDYYVEKDLAANGAFKGTSYEESRRSLRGATQVVAKEIGDPYISYSIAQYAIRFYSLSVLAMTRAAIYTKAIDFAKLQQAYTEGLAADTVLNDALKSANDLTRGRIEYSTFLLGSASILQAYHNTNLTIIARNAVLANPNATAEVQYEAAQRAHSDTYVGVGGVLTQMVALGLYNVPASLNTESYELLRTWSAACIPWAFAANDVYSSIVGLVNTFRHNPDLDAEKARVNQIFLGTTYAVRGIGGIYTFAAEMLKWTGWDVTLLGGEGIKDHDALQPIFMNTVTTSVSAASALLSLIYITLPWN